ncbi:hypothetical protein CAPTEDRAFT_152427 [Capitella teleta]|uniref:Protein SMG9 n=1 Tax=Capitella teleta TaxID=283909 RepID=R7V317_CAPTE|nr:hypothetical protein CAPTEDRAFT_152427 [Capitella teleta]|eukprot:ELU10061.1 hypothetical protein CAPTEDRAFT_152427 [Capitella teleta]
MEQSVKLVDEDLLWCESGNFALQDQTDFSVIGAIGLQGSGKSTVLSHLAGVVPQEANRSVVFHPQSRTVREVCSHQTAGIDLHLTEERTIFLDSQPVLSASILDQMIQHDVKYHGEYSTVENCMEMQSLQLGSFLFTVCNIVIVVMEGFSDLNVFRFLQTAEMLKPQTPQPHDSPSEGLSEIYPHIVFVVNHAGADDFKAGSYEKMQTVISRLMSQSNLKFKGVCNMRDLIPGLSSSSPHSDVNLYLLPEKASVSDQLDDPLSMHYRGYPTFEFIIESLTKKLLAMPRHLLTHTTLTEKNWFHYAARSWESVKKSGLISEYNRLLP